MSAYAVTALFYDAIAGDQRAAVDQKLASALQGLDLTAHPVVDIGAGTGLTTAAIAAAYRQIKIVAVEPDPAMRPALMTRVWSSSDLRQRVSILPMSVLLAPLPPLISAAVASASLVHFDPAQRQRLWTLLDERLAPGGRAVIEIQCPVAEDIAETCIGIAQVGDVSYETRASAERVNEQQQRWRISYVSRLRGDVLERLQTDYLCWVLSCEDLLAEVSETGLTGSSDGNLVVLEK